MPSRENNSGRRRTRPRPGGAPGARPRQGTSPRPGGGAGGLRQPRRSNPTTHNPTTPTTRARTTHPTRQPATTAVVRTPEQWHIIYRRRRIAAVLVLVAIFATLFVLMANSDRTSKPMLINGDSVGRMAGESMDDYRARAATSRTGIDPDEQVFALVSFTRPLSPVEAGRLLEDAHIRRVGSFILDGLPPVALPEPTGNANRADVFSAWLGRARHLGLPAEGLDGVIVYGPNKDLDALINNPDVLTVEAAPPGAAWGRFGVQPVHRRAENTPLTPPSPAAPQSATAAAAGTAPQPAAGQRR